METTDIKAIQDERIMADGRPAFAWANEIAMLRAENERLKSSEQVKGLQDWMAALHIAQIAYNQRPWDRGIDIVLTIEHDLDKFHGPIWERVKITERKEVPKE